jgi:Xaa-Pro dipeptidase
MGASKKEIDRRNRAIREAMKKDGLEAMIIFSNVELSQKGAARYLTNYRLTTRKQYLFLPLSGDPVLIVPTIGQQYWAGKTSWIKDIRSGGETEGLMREVAKVVKSAGLEKETIGIVNLMTSMPYYDFQLLTKELPAAVFKDSTELLYAVRAVKSPNEIEMIRETTDIADSCYERLLEIIQPGVDEREIMAEINKLLTLRGVEDTLILTAKGPSFPCFIAQPGPYIFKKGDHYVFSVELSGPNGYWSQIVRPLCLGTPADLYRRIFAVGKKALDRGAATLVPGKRVSEVVHVVSEEVHKEGLKTGIWCGHGMGIDLGDGLGLFEDNQLELKEGMVITVHPHVMSPDGKKGLLLGDTFVVRHGGGQNLSRTPCELKCL